MPDTIGAADLEGFYRAFSRSDFDAMAALLDDDIVFVFPGATFGGTRTGRGALIGTLGTFQRELLGSSLNFDVEWSAVIGDRGIVEFKTTGTTKDGRLYRNAGVALFRIRNGKLVELRDYLDTEAIRDFFGQ